MSPVPGGAPSLPDDSGPPFPNAERIVGAAAIEILGAGRAGGTTPPDLAAALPFVTVRRAGGASDTVNDYPILVIESHATTIVEATDVAEAIRSRLLAGWIRNAHGQIDRTICTSGHIEIPHANPEIRRLVTSYRATCRRLPTGT